jgi:hypothetical protein
MAKTKSRLGTSIVVIALFVGVGYWAVTNLAQHSTGRAEDTVEKWSTPRRMTKPATSDRPTHTVKFFVEALPARDLEVFAKAGTGQSRGPEIINDSTWSWTAHGVRTGEFAELTADDVTNIDAPKRCWITVDGKLYRNAGRDAPYQLQRNLGRCRVVVIVG